LVLDCKRDAQAFCRSALWEEDPGLRRRLKAARPGYAEAAAWLRELLRAGDSGGLTSDALERFEERVNTACHNKPVHRTLTHLWRGSGPPFFFFEWDQKAYDGVEHLAHLLTQHPKAFARFRVCRLGPPECERLFWDASPRGNQKFCCTKHKDREGQRRHRQRGSRETRVRRGAAV
jgi:hypothetical protein